MSAEPKPVTLYTSVSPNGYPISIALEELGIPYELKVLDFSTDDQHSEAYLKINPNGKIPSLVDHKNPAGDFIVFESSAILLYIAQHYDKERKISYDPVTEANLYSEELQWLFFVHGGVPMLGQTAHFLKFAPEKIPYAIERFRTEVKRLLSVLEDRLEGREWLVGPHYGLADIRAFSWAAYASLAEIDLSAFPKVEAWIKRCVARDATYAGLSTPSRTTPVPLLDRL